jgi:hypothetical protein
VLHPSSKSEQFFRDFGYGLHYKNVSVESLSEVRHPFLTVIKDQYFHVLGKLSDYMQERGGHRTVQNIVVVIHDPRDISNRISSLIKRWKVITIRKTVQDYLNRKYDIDSQFLYHPFYPYPTEVAREMSTSSSSPSFSDGREGAVSICRVGFGKNIDIIVRANKILESYFGSINNNKTIKIYGCPTSKYVYLFLAHQRAKNSYDASNGNVITSSNDFKKYYHGKFVKSFSAISQILSKHKFVVDLSVIKNDGGGTQYTFLEAIHNGCALILNKRWLEDLRNDPKYCDFREGYNCFAINDEKDLATLIKNDPDTARITHNANKLMDRHIKIDWSQLIDNN